MVKNKIKPHRSLRNLLIFSYLIVSMAPVLGVTYYIYKQFQEVLYEELIERLKLNGDNLQRKIEIQLNGLREIHQIHSKDQVLHYYLLNEDFEQIKNQISKWEGLNSLSNVSIFDREGYLIASIKNEKLRKNNIKNSKNKSKEKLKYSKKLTNEFLSMVSSKKENYIIDYKKNSIDVIIFSFIKSKSNSVLGYIEEVLTLTRAEMKDLSKKLGVNIYSYNPYNNRIISSHSLSKKIIKQIVSKFFQTKKFHFSLELPEKSYILRKVEVPWGEKTMTFALGLSPSSLEKIIDNLGVIIGSAILAVFVLIVLLSIIMSRLVLKPLKDLVDAIQSMNLHKEVELLEIKNKTEIGLLANSFNEMSRRIYKAQLQLVHSEKMAGLGQLVAGVAHELNNPISFIYSNMKTLNEYAETLSEQVMLAITDSERFKKQLDLKEINYITQDMPKLIKSCEDGAQRTKEIVLGLRSFSRLDEGDLKKVDLNEGIENTLVLLNSEIKNRITIKKDFAPHIMAECYPSQINQVIMNILTNAIQSIEGEGHINITTSEKENYCYLRFEDSGFGMSPQQIEHVFEPFYTTKKIGKGTGLGMSISYGIIEKHQGKILIQSQEGKGSVFTIVLPQKFSEKTVSH